MEVWKPIPSCGGLFEASTLGRIRSIDRYVRHNYGGMALRKGRVLSPHKAKNGYLYVCIFRDGRWMKSLVHRLIVEAFSPDFHGQEINHLDFDRTNNRLSNLELSDHRSNVSHSVNHGRFRKKMTAESVAALRAAHDAGANYERLAERFGISSTMASLIVRKKWWA